MLPTVVFDAAMQASSSSYVNHDGMRVDDGRYKAFLQDAAAVVPQPRIFTGDAASAAHTTRGPSYSKETCQW
jgi:hypothetical protein